MNVAPIPCRWTGEEFVPLPRFGRLVNEEYVVGEVYHMVMEKERSPKSHRQFFAIIKDVFDSLPEHETRWPTAEHFRKWALIKAGYCDMQTFPCASKAEARRWAAILGSVDAYAIVVPKATIVIKYTARSIAWANMGHRDFQACKDAVFKILAEEIQVAPAVLEQRMLEAA